MNDKHKAAIVTALLIGGVFLYLLLRPKQAAPADIPNYLTVNMPTNKDLSGGANGLPLPNTPTSSSCGCSGSGNDKFYTSLSQMVSTYQDGASNILDGWLSNIENTLKQQYGAYFGS